MDGQSDGGSQDCLCLQPRPEAEVRGATREGGAEGAAQQEQKQGAGRARRGHQGDRVSEHQQQCSGHCQDC